MDEPPEVVALLRQIARRASDDDGAALERQVEGAVVTTSERTWLHVAVPEDCPGCRGGTASSPWS